jgi:hypothetical protein
MIQYQKGSAGRNSHQFMVRLWLEELGDKRYELRGSVKHVNSGEVLYFHDWSTLETFLEEPLRSNSSEGIQSGGTSETNRAFRKDEI